MFRHGVPGRGKLYEHLLLHFKVGKATKHFEVGGEITEMGLASVFFTTWLEGGDFVTIPNPITSRVFRERHSN